MTRIICTWLDHCMRTCPLGGIIWHQMAAHVRTYIHTSGDLQPATYIYIIYCTHTVVHDKSAIKWMEWQALFCGQLTGFPCAASCHIVHHMTGLLPPKCCNHRLQSYNYLLVFPPKYCIKAVLGPAKWLKLQRLHKQVADMTMCGHVNICRPLFI